VLKLLRLAAKAVAAHPEVVPSDLLPLVDSYVADLYFIHPHPRLRGEAPTST
jgi:hypothetical protein